MFIPILYFTNQRHKAGSTPVRLTCFQCVFKSRWIETSSHLESKARQNHDGEWSKGSGLCKDGYATENQNKDNTRHSPKISIYHIYNAHEDSLLDLIHVYLFHFLNLRIKAHSLCSIPDQNESCRDAISDSKRQPHKELSPVGTTF